MQEIRAAHQTKNADAKQLDDGIADTLVWGAATGHRERFGQYMR
jgi:hypothetical protein